MNNFTLTSFEYPPRRRLRILKDPSPRFRPSQTRQMDAIKGCVELQVPHGHLARDVWSVVKNMDTKDLETQYSALGRHGYHPKRLLAVWVYASLMGVHHSTKVAKACQTDVAFKWLCGGDSPSGPTLRRMRMKQGVFFAAALEQTVVLAEQLGVVDVEALAVDSVRIRAHASMDSVRTEKRSTKRLKELGGIDTSGFTKEELDLHNDKMRKHLRTLQECKERGVTSIVATNDMAALMKFPSGASAPAHRATIVSSGASERLIICALIDSASTDHGKLKGAVLKARGILGNNGDKMVVAADAGYFSDRDLQFAKSNREWVDLLIPPVARGRDNSQYFSKSRFKIDSNRVATCPAGRRMLGPYNNSRKNRIVKWVGHHCRACDLKPKCTPGRERAIQVDYAKEEAILAMKERMSQPGASDRYNQRIATVEPVFSFVEDVMGYRRCSSRSTQTITAEILLKMLSYNIDRLIRIRRTRKKLSCLFFEITY